MDEEEKARRRSSSSRLEHVNSQRRHRNNSLAVRDRDTEIGDLGETRKEDGEPDGHPLTALSFPREARPVESDREREEDPGGPPAVASSDTALPLAERGHSRRERCPEPSIAGGSPQAGTALSSFATTLYTVSYLVFFSMFGALARIGLQALTDYPGAPVVTGVLWANVGGSLLMGLFAEDKNLFLEEWGLQPSRKTDRDSGRPASSLPEAVLSPEESLKKHKAIKKSIPLYIGLTTGFCGSFTSFSTFMLDVFLALSNDLRNPNTANRIPRNGGYSFMAVVAIILYTASLSLSALIFGAHLALALDKYTPTIPFILSRKALDPLFVVLGLGCWLGSIFLALWPPDRHLGAHEFWRGRAIFTVVFAPLGCLLRYYVSLLLNPRVRTFPLGTFVVNIFGTMVLGMCFDLQHARDVVGVDRLAGCQVLKGVMDGFCGCLTTVSTWVAEMHDLELRYAYRYGIVSVGFALAVLVVSIGAMRWTVGLDDPVC